MYERVDPLIDEVFERDSARDETFESIELPVGHCTEHLVMDAIVAQYTFRARASELTSKPCTEMYVPVKENSLNVIALISINGLWPHTATFTMLPRGRTAANAASIVRWFPAQSRTTSAPRLPVAWRTAAGTSALASVGSYTTSAPCAVASSRLLDAGSEMAIQRAPNTLFLAT